MKRKIIFIGGVHGVGKTTLCTKLCDSMNMKHYSASDLIKKISNIKFSEDKKVKGIEKNQDTLITAVNNYIDPESFCFLDGHFCLLNEHGKVIEIPIPTFTELKPAAIVVLKGNPESIFLRMKNRDGNEMDVEDISIFQEKELEYSQRISKLLEIPWFTEDPIDGTDRIKSFIKDIVEAVV